MRNIYLMMLSVALGLSATAQTKLDPPAMKIAQDYRELKQGLQPVNPDLRMMGDSETMAGTLRTMSAKAPLNDVEVGRRRVGAILTMAEGYSVADIPDYVNIQTEITDAMATVDVAIDDLEKLGAEPAVRRVEIGYPQKVHMWNARPSANVDAVQTGSGLSKAFTGKGVVVGMFDTGMDPNHVNFTKKGDPSTSRVKAVYVYNTSAGTLSQSLETPDAIKGFQTDLTNQTHGTHVMGMAAGGYNGPGVYMDGTTQVSSDNMPIYGVAYDADIVMAGGYLYNSSIINGVSKIMDYAEAHNQPAVVNLSLGSLLGAHDGSDGTSQSLAALGKRGIICISAGNDADGDYAFTMQGAGAMGSTVARNTVGMSNYVSGDATEIWITFSGEEPRGGTPQFAIWDTQTSQIVQTIDLVDTNGSWSGYGNSSSSSGYTRPGGKFADAFTASSYFRYATTTFDSGRYAIIIEHKLAAGTNSMLKPCLRFIRSKVNNEWESVWGATDGGDNNNHPFFTNYSVAKSYKDGTDTWLKFTSGSNDGSISSMATGDNILAVGAYTTSVTPRDLGGGYYDYGETVNKMCSFSSYGPVVGTFPVEYRPHVSAPGSAIISSVNSYYSGTSYNTSSGVATVGGKNYYFAPMQGTSMACPFTTGTVALMLEANPKLTIDDVKDIVKSTSVKTSDYNAGSSSYKNQWGAGQLEALEGVKAAMVKAAAIENVWADDSKRLVVTQNGDLIDVFVAGENSMTATLYGIDGSRVAQQRVTGDQMQLTTGHLRAGVYVLTVEGSKGRFSQKVLVK